MTNNKLRIKTFPVFFLSFAWTGFLPKAPGTWGTLFGMIVPILLKYFQVSIIPQIIAFIITLFFASAYAEKIQKKEGLTDPGWIVIDEVLGIWLTCLFIKFQITSFVLAFIAFRFFDITKIWPANLIDAKMKSGFGVMLDDLVAGLYAGLLLFGIESSKIIF